MSSQIVAFVRARHAEETAPDRTLFKVERGESLDLAGGQTVDGPVLFDVPKCAVKSANVALKPNTHQELYGSWQTMTR